jgi:hypothetical protein
VIGVGPGVGFGLTAVPVIGPEVQDEQMNMMSKASAKKEYFSCIYLFIGYMFLNEKR